jgi:sugar phosphate isomerase/epimerase
MKLGFITAALADRDLESALRYLKDKGVQAVELSTRMNGENPHVNTKELLMDDRKVKEFLALLKHYDMEISALSCHGNPIHPQKDIAWQDHKDFEETVLLAEKLGVRRVITFSGCPGDYADAKYPNWVTCSWPEDYLNILKYQWEDVLIPYWEKAAGFAGNHGIDMICLEMHPGFCVYNPETLLKLRDSVGPTIGANFDPSHLFWQGIDPVMAIKELSSAIYHFHAKDVKVDKNNTRINGVLDTKHYSKEIERSWIFRTVGYGHDTQTWKDIVSTLRLTGYDYVLSIEHEDSLMSVKEGADKAIRFLNEVIIQESSDGMWWA